MAREEKRGKERKDRRRLPKTEPERERPAGPGEWDTIPAESKPSGPADPQEWDTIPAEPVRGKPEGPTGGDTLAGVPSSFPRGPGTVPSARPPVDDEARTLISGSATVAPGDPLAKAGPGEAKRLGPYEILEEIGRGGMGVVYRAFHAGLKREVALKVLIAGEDASEDAIARFHREAAAVAKLGHHPHIVPVYDIGEQGRLHYFAMHFVAGKPLDRLIDDGEVAPRRAAVLAQKAAQALQHAHGHGILHRDVKPANILVTPEGEPQLTDFGLACDVQSDERVTRSGTAMGSPQYMSPEQADGRTDAIDHRTDVYGLGAALYEMLTVRPPFEGSSVVNVIKKVLLDDPVPPRTWNPAVPRDLETVCLKALEKDPERRYATAAAMAEDLRRFLADEPIAARPASLAYRLVKRVRRNRAAVLVGAAGVLAVVAAGVFFLGVRPALDRARELAADRAVLTAAAESRRAGAVSAAELLEAARQRFRDLDFAACAEACRLLEDRFGPLQGSVSETPHVRNPSLVEAEFADLLEPASYPLAAAAALRALALEGAGDAAGSRASWARAYWRALQDSEGSKAEENRGILKEALLAIGRDLLEREDFDRARGTFEEYLHRFPEPGGGPGTLSLARALLGAGRLEEALAAYRAALDGSPGSERDAACRALLESLLPVREFPFPTPPWAVGGPRVLASDLDGDGRQELLWIFQDEGGGSRAHVQAFRRGRFEAIGDPVLEGPGEGAPRGAEFLPRAADLDGDGTDELILFRADLAARRCALAVFARRGAGFERRNTVLASCPNFPKYLETGDVDGDGLPEILVGFHSGPGGLSVYPVRPGLQVGSPAALDLPSFLYGLKVLPFEEGAKAVLSLGPYATYRILTARFDPANGRPLVDEPAAPVRCLTNRLELLPGGAGICFLTGRSGLASDWRVSVEDREPEPGTFLPSGLYVQEKQGDTLGKPSPLLVEPHMGEGNSALLPWQAAGERFFLLADGETLFVGPVDGGTRWIRMPFGSTPGESVRAELDGDPAPELVLTRSDGTVRIYGAGPPAPPPFADPAKTGRGSPRSGDPALAIALSLSEMGQTDQAVEAFEAAFAASASEELRAAALVGRADALFQGGRPEEAAEAYEEALRFPPGRGRAVPGKAACLLSLERWDALLSFLRNELKTGGLPGPVRGEMEALAAEVAPLADLRPVLAFDGALEPPWECWTLDPFVARRTPEGLVLGGDGFRRNSWLVPARFAGDPFRMTVRLVLEELDWATFVHVGLLGCEEAPEGGCLGSLRRWFCGQRFLLSSLEAGDDTSHPAIFVFHATSAGPYAAPLATRHDEIVPYPPALPRIYEFVLESRPRSGSLKLVLKDGAGAVVREQILELPVGFPAGNAFFGVALGPGYGPRHGWGTYRTRVRLERFELWAPTAGSLRAGEAPRHPEDALARANASLAQGRVERALAAYDALLDEDAPQPAVGSGCTEGAAGEPALRSRARLFRALARFRSGNGDGAARDVRAALLAEPREVFTFLRRAFAHMDGSERDFFARAVRTTALDPESGWVPAFLDAMAGDGLLPAEQARHWAEQWVRADPDSEQRLAIAAEVMVCESQQVAFVHRVFSDTAFGETLRIRRREILRSRAAGDRIILDVYVRREWEEYLAEFPGDLEAVRDLAVFLADCPRAKIRDPRRAEELARVLVDAAKTAADAAFAVTAWETLALALHAGEKFEDAVDALERAQALCPPGRRDRRWELGKKLSRYREDAQRR